MEGRINTPLTSSCGRLFDAVSALLGICGTTTFEGQAAVALEMAAFDAADLPAYPFDINEIDGVRQVGLKRLFEALLDDIFGGVAVGLISRRFHATLAAMIGEMAELLSARTGIRSVALSGGCFQNRLLTGMSIDLLLKRGFTCLTHRRVPCNDGGVSLGQAAIGSAAGDAAWGRC
jgi:hydrogenase maturation protein HypF